MDPQLRVAEGNAGCHPAEKTPTYQVRQEDRHSGWNVVLFHETDFDCGSRQTYQKLLAMCHCTGRYQP